MTMKHARTRLTRALAATLSACLALPPAAIAQVEPRRSHITDTRSRASERVTLNFVNADIEAVTRAMSAMINRPILVDPRVRGTITVYSEQPLTVRESYLTYLSGLRGLGFAIVETGGLLKLVPEAEARLQTGTVQVGNASARAGQIVTQIFTLQHENPNNLVPILRPLITANNTINVSPGTSSLVITDYAENLQRLAKVIATLDQPSSTDFEIVPLSHAVAADVAALVQKLSDSGSGATAAGGASGGKASVLADNRSNSVIIRASNQAQLRGLRETIARLDRPSPGGGPGGNLWVVHLKNADATQLATVLRAAFADAATAGGAGGASTASVRTTVSPNTTNPSNAANTAGGAANTPIAASAQPSVGGFVQADPSTNSLIITAPEPLYRQVRAMIDQLDTRRAQVYIESMIVEVSGDNAADFGFQWQGLIGNRGDTNLVGVGTNFGSTGNIIDISAGAATSAAASVAAIAEGLNVALVRNFGGTYALAAIARMLQSQTSTNIISTPNLITLDNEEAKIVVGSNVPFITGQFTNTGTSLQSPFQTIERKDVGLTLRIRPQIGEGGTVRLTIYQEKSSVSSTVAPGTTNAGPSTDKRLIESNVIVDDGGIIVLGGLIEDRFVENRSKVPLLGDIPLVGGLFRSESREKRRTNLMVFLRPTVLRDAASADRLSLDRYDLIRANQKDAQPQPSVVIPIQDAPVLPPMRPENAGNPTTPPSELTPAPAMPAAPSPTTPAPAEPAASAPAPLVRPVAPPLGTGMPRVGGP
jgi:general secretion pathway protein D